jgi:large subunit ribosomal protein L10
LKKEQKSQVVEEIAAQIADSDAIYASDYRGITVAQAAALRARLREAGASFRIVKNTLTLRAADKAGAEQVKELIEGPTAFTFVRGDPALAAKTLDAFARAENVLELRGGLLGEQLIDSDALRALARLPGREQLNAQLAGVVAAPLTGLVRGLNALLAGLAVALGQISEQRGPEAAAEEAAAEPAAPAPAEAPADEPAEQQPEPEQEQPEGAGEPEQADAQQAEEQQPEEQQPEEQKEAE